MWQSKHISHVCWIFFCKNNYSKRILDLAMMISRRQIYCLVRMAALTKHFHSFYVRFIAINNIRMVDLLDYKRQCTCERIFLLTVIVFVRKEMVFLMPNNNNKIRIKISRIYHKNKIKKHRMYYTNSLKQI